MFSLNPGFCVDNQLIYGTWFWFSLMLIFWPTEKGKKKNKKKLANTLTLFKNLNGHKIFGSSNKIKIGKLYNLVEKGDFDFT